ncbi:nuclear export factor GLE1 [Catenulispora acidiphila DSM 44928]|uniref:Nuclear export factor GLE1 n=1 Tax=Catenulispora acidiphila (strain DSM 44928 / JCM 14897 / NBRC 102108 / NRRL B-24433 / ID139908) TaxID=479433 RepID=C7Q5V4_CATAD|nr:YcnI family protein [Catenulispora acidiphila]ACU70051.1 nuclear export factor GLE1 [Catenulispora acidiphila DSM 44928]
MSKLSRGAALTGAVLTVLAIAGPASAHVTISPNTTAKGGSDIELTFRVPNEEAQATTTQVEVDFPTDKPITGVLPEPTPGWTVKVDNVTLATPIKTDDGTVTQVVQRITWSGGQLAPGQYQGFRVMLGSVPDDADSLTFKALQTYSNGDVVRWIDVQQSGQPEPDHPAPVLTLGAAAPDGDASSAPSSPQVTATASSAPNAGAGTPAASAKSSDSTARGLGIAGIVIGVLGLGAGAFGVGAARRKGAGTSQ